MTGDDFRDAVMKFAEDVGADHVVIAEARIRKTEEGVVVGPWIDAPPTARVHRTVYIPYIARTRIAGGLGLVIVPDAMTDHVTPVERDGE